MEDRGQTDDLDFLSFRQVIHLPENFSKYHVQ